MEPPRIPSDENVSAEHQANPRVEASAARPLRFGGRAREWRGLIDSIEVDGLEAMKPPSIGALALGIIPFIAMCFSVALWDRIEPMILGLPFNLFWLILWILLTPCCLWGAYRLDGKTAPTDRGA
jgi:hypothetical protein